MTTMKNGLGDLTLGTVTVGDNYIQADKLPQIRQITDDLIRQSQGITTPGNISTIAPQLLVQAEVKGTSVILVGIEPQEELAIKSWWQVNRGEFISSDGSRIQSSEHGDQDSQRRSESFTLTKGTLVCDSCGTVFNATTGIGMKGACVKFAKQAASYEVKDGNILIKGTDLITAYQNTLNPARS